MSRARIYLDHASTTPLIPEVIEEMYNVSQEIFGNPSSIHKEGIRSKSYIEESRRIISHFLNCSPSQVYFTSCGTESNNMILKNLLDNQHIKTVISTKIEHPSVLNTIIKYTKINSCELKYLDVSNQGIVDLTQLENYLLKSTGPCLVSLMHVNNELGTKIDLIKVGQLCKTHGAFFHSDTVQSMGTSEWNVQVLEIDAISGSAHKFHGPKGIGFVYLKDPTLFHPLLEGGGQERNLRSGTENILGIAGLAKSIEILQKEKVFRFAKMEELNSYLRNRLLNSKISFEFNTPEPVLSSAKILNINLPFFKGIELLIVNLDIHGIAVSGGSACSSGAEKSSHVLEQTRPGNTGKSIRFSFSHFNTEAEIDFTMEVLEKLIQSAYLV
ncbi:MAG: cysteine desulfurase [Bacteroidota bacterium]|nr:cysteine desulfurase [Bacteroidota bacterium]